MPSPLRMFGKPRKVHGFGGDEAVEPQRQACVCGGVSSHVLNRLRPSDLEMVKDVQIQ